MFDMVMEFYIGEEKEVVREKFRGLMFCYLNDINV